MTKIAEIQDRGAAVAWSPISSHPDLLALGTKVRITNALSFMSLELLWNIYLLDIYSFILNNICIHCSRYRAGFWRYWIRRSWW